MEDTQELWMMAELRLQIKMIVNVLTEGGVQGKKDRFREFIVLASI
jgi:hypothetical protein